MTRWAVVMMLVGVAGCPSPLQPPEPDLAQARPLAAPPAVAPTPTPTLAPTPAPTPVTAEVEIGGTVDNRAAFKGDVLAWITDGPCWQPATRALGSTKTQPEGAFFIEVFVAQGTPLWVCAATADGNAAGALDKAPLMGKGLGEVSYSGLHLALKKGKRVTAPPPKIAPPPAPKK